MAGQEKEAKVGIVDVTAMQDLERPFALKLYPSATASVYPERSLLCEFRRVKALTRYRGLCNPSPSLSLPPSALIKMGSQENMFTRSVRPLVHLLTTERLAISPTR